MKKSLRTSVLEALLALAINLIANALWFFVVVR
jgi:hypothetical protein